MREIYHSSVKFTRTSVKGLLYCDALNDNVVPDNTSGKFDCITSSACLEGACLTLDSFRKSLKRVSGLLRDGHVVIFCFLGDEHYDVGDKIFGALSLCEDEVVTAFRNAGFIDIQSRAKNYSMAEKEHYGEADAHGGCLTLYACKSPVS